MLICKARFHLDRLSRLQALDFKTSCHISLHVCCRTKVCVLVFTLILQHGASGESVESQWPPLNNDLLVLTCWVIICHLSLFMYLRFCCVVHDVLMLAKGWKLQHSQEHFLVLFSVRLWCFSSFIYLLIFLHQCVSPTAPNKALLTFVCDALFCFILATWTSPYPLHSCITHAPLTPTISLHSNSYFPFLQYNSVSFIQIM